MLDGFISRLAVTSHIVTCMYGCDYTAYEKKFSLSDF
jgi:hypothetical protein